MICYFPFSELLDGNYFIFHPDHWDSATESHTLFRKINTNRYQNPASKAVLIIPEHLIHKTEVSFIKCSPSPRGEIFLTPDYPTSYGDN